VREVLRFAPGSNHPYTVKRLSFNSCPSLPQYSASMSALEYRFSTPIAGVPPIFQVE